MTLFVQPRPKADDTERSARLAGKLARAESALTDSVGPTSPLVARLAGLRRRLVAERLQLAVLGQFKRGKSTFVNALLGAPLLPTAVVPLTAIATFIGWQPQPLVRVSFKGERPAEEFHGSDPDEIRAFLFRYVAEEANPQNRLCIERVEMFYPAAVLADGTFLIDTPGVGSTLRHNTDAALHVLPECDAALFVVSADPPITEAEIEYLRRCKARVARMFFVLNKIDYLQPDEQRSVCEFLRKTLRDHQLCDPDTPIFSVSARMGLAAKQANDREMLERSGMAGVEAHLVQYLAAEKRRALEQAVTAKAADVLSRAKAETELRTRALKMPLEELETKTAAFEEALRSIEEQRVITRDLLAGDRRRLVENLESRIDALRTEASAKLAAAIDESLSGDVTAKWQETAQTAIATSTEEIFEAVRENLVKAFAADAGGILSSYSLRIDGLIANVRRTAVEIFDVPLSRELERESFQLGEDPYWVTQSVGSTLIPDLTPTIDRLLPVRLRRARLRQRLVQQADELVLRNAENLRWAILRGLDDTCRKALVGFEERLDEAIATTKGVIEEALARRRDRSFVIDPEVERLNRALAALANAAEDIWVDEPGAIRR